MCRVTRCSLLGLGLLLEQGLDPLIRLRFGMASGSSVAPAGPAPQRALRRSGKGLHGKAVLGGQSAKVGGLGFLFW